MGTTAEEERVRREIGLAKRLARAVGARLVWRRNQRNWGLLGDPRVWWNDPGSVLRGERRRSPARRRDLGLLDLGGAWEWSGRRRKRGVSLPPGITKGSSDEELDLVLSALGF